MATRIYKDTADFDTQQAHFTIETVNGSQYYLRIGGLNGEDRRLIASLIDDGFVGFFQDDVRIGIAGITSTYDAENDRIEIDRDLPELKIEDEYVIRFTQARPGEDGEGGIVTPGEDGNNGWSPKFATVPDGERRVLQVADWFGGGGTKPDTGQYIGATGFVEAIADGVNIRGPAGQRGRNGQDGTILTNAHINTRGPLVARSGYIPRELDGNLITDGSWHFGPDIPNTFGRLNGYLSIPQMRPYSHVIGLWAVATRGRRPEDSAGTSNNLRELDEAFMPWGPGALKEQQDSYDVQQATLHFKSGVDLGVLFYQNLDANSGDPRIIIQGYGERLPSDNCRVWIYLAGFFIET